MGKESNGNTTLSVKDIFNFINRELITSRLNERSTHVLLMQDTRLLTAHVHKTTNACTNEMTINRLHY